MNSKGSGVGADYAEPESIGLSTQLISFCHVKIWAQYCQTLQFSKGSQNSSFFGYYLLKDQEAVFKSISWGLNIL